MAKNYHPDGNYQLLYVVTDSRFSKGRVSAILTRQKPAKYNDLFKYGCRNTGNWMESEVGSYVAQDPNLQ